MKNMILVFLALAASLDPYPLQAQRVLSDGTLTYDIRVVSSGPEAPVSNLFQGSTYTLYFKGYLIRTDLDLGTFRITNIINTQEGTVVQLRIMSGRKFLTRMKISDLKTQMLPYQDAKFTPARGRKNIAGYACREVIARIGDSLSFPVFYTPEILPGEAGRDFLFRNLGGIPLEYENATDRLRMTFTARKLDLAPVPAYRFEIPKSGYRELTPIELKQIMGTRRKP